MIPIAEADAELEHGTEDEEINVFKEKKKPTKAEIQHKKKSMMRAIKFKIGEKVLEE